MDSVGVTGRDDPEPLLVIEGISTRNIVESFSVVVDDVGDNCPTDDIGERRILILITGL